MKFTTPTMTIKKQGGVRNENAGRYISVEGLAGVHDCDGRTGIHRDKRAIRFYVAVFLATLE